MVNLTAALEKITGITHTLDGPYLVAAEPGGEPYLAHWDEAVLGPRPTDAQIETAGLEVAIEIRVAAIQAEKCRARDAGFDVDGVHFDSDQAARMAYLEFALQLAGDAAYSKQWKASEGVWVTMEATLFAQVKAAGEAHISAAFSWQEARDSELAAIKAAVAASTMTTTDALTAVAAVSTTYTAGATS